MSTRRGRHGIVLPVLVVLLVAMSLGCAAKRSQNLNRTYVLREDRGFLFRASKDENLLCYVNPRAKFSMYDRIVLDQVKVPKESKDPSEDTAAERREQLGKLVEVFRSELRYDYDLVQEPGPGVMRLRLAFVGVDGTSTPEEQTPDPDGQPTSSEPVFSVKSNRDGPLILGELTDAMSGETLMAMMVQKSPNFPFWGTGDFDRRSRDTYRFWASRLRQRLEEFRRQSSSVSASQGDRWTALQAPFPTKG